MRLYGIEIHRDSVVSSAVGKYFVEAESGEVAARYALAVVMDEWPGERLRVKSVSEADGRYLGRVEKVKAKKR